MPITHTHNKTPVGWRSLLENDSSALIYSHDLILQLYAETFGHSLHFFTIENDSGKVIAGHAFLEKKIRLPFVGERARVWYAYAPPIIYDGENRNLLTAQIIQAAEDTASRLGVASISFWDSPHASAPLATFPHFTCETLQNVCVDLTPGAEELFSSLDKGLRKNIRATQTNGLVISRGTHEDLNEYYDCYAQHHRERGLETYPKIFFEKLLTIFETEKVGEFWVAKKDGVLAAGLMASSLHNRLYEMAVASSSAYLPLFPNDALKWGAIQYACGKKFSVFDLSNIDPRPQADSPTAGINRYKMKWGRVVNYSKYKKQNIAAGIRGLFI